MTFTADITAWTAKAKANMEHVVFGSVEDLFELATRRQASVKEIGTYREGFVPVDLGFLIGTAHISVNGVVKSRGTVSGATSAPPDTAVALAGMDLGDSIQLAFTAEYALRIEYGYRGTDKLGRSFNQNGRFFVRNAVMQWQRIVDENARYIGT